eukprot:GEMP01013626.1.p1 GENE.GEMP01013626.1~~GEMP01013626.1.p1  ORF type:complete len:643 (+),score=142.22 GEMP01013626.1:87-2015(+)
MERAGEVQENPSEAEKKASEPHEDASDPHEDEDMAQENERNTSAVEQVEVAPKSKQSAPSKSATAKQSHDVFYSDSPRFLNQRFLAPRETTVGELKHPLCLCPAAPIRPEALRRTPSGKNINLRDFAWLLQKLAGLPLNNVRMAETILLSNGKPLNVFFHKDGKLQCTRFRASAELYIIMRQWLLKTTKASSQKPALASSPKRDKTWGMEICALQFADGAVRTLAEGELESMLKQRKPKRSQWVDTKTVQLLPNAGTTFDRPLQYITYHYNGRLSSAKQYMRHLAKEMRAALQDKEVKAEAAIEEMQKLLDPLHIDQGDFYFAQKSKSKDNVAGESVGILYLLGASNLIVRKRKVAKREPRKEGDDAVVKCFDDTSFLESIEGRRPTKKMEGVLEQLEEYYESQVQRAPSPTRRTVNGGSSPPSPRSFPSTPIKHQQSYFSIKPPECPPSPRKPNFMRPPRPKSVGDLLGTSRSSTWFQTELKARQINFRHSKSALSRPQSTNDFDAHAHNLDSAIFGTHLSTQLKQLRMDGSVLSPTYFSKMFNPDAASAQCWATKLMPQHATLPRPQSTGALMNARPFTRSGAVLQPNTRNGGAVLRPSTRDGGALLRPNTRNDGVPGTCRPKSFVISALITKEIPVKPW